MDKRFLREKVKADLAAFKNKEEEDKEIVNRIRSLKEYKENDVILAYSPLFDEVDISPIFCDDKLFLFPYINGDEMAFSTGPLKIDRFNIPAPIEKRETAFDRALIIVPARALDRNGFRLGRGAGYYDRYLKRNKKRLFSLSICYSIQLFDHIPHNAEDEKVNSIITGNELLFF